ncbi:MAG TPA: glycosyltransferase family 4 protein [Anaerolineales bacterium]|nr:glycosyltransferase family 4 protein [Anaerolineales bacterium]
MKFLQKSLHILLIHQAFVDLGEAGGTRHAEFARHLASRGQRVTVIASSVSYLTGKERGAVQEEAAQVPGVRVLRAATYRGLHRSFVHRLLSFFTFTLSSFFIGLSVKDVDLVWGTTPPIFQALTAWLLARLKRVPFLLEVRDLWPAFAVEVGVLRNPALIRASEWLESFLYRHADQLVVNSPGFVDHVQARGGRQIAVVPNGADAAMFDPQANGAEFRKQYGLPADAFVVVYAGAHGLSNDLGVVLQAAELLKTEEKFLIVLVGDGKDKPALQAQAADLKLDNVRFVPPLPKTQMSEALAAADACLAILKPIQLYATVYPNKVFDYMAAGRPVLLAIDGVMRKVVEDGGAGVFVPPGDPQALAQAMTQLADDPAKARSLGRAGRATLQAHFDRTQLAKQILRVIQETAGGKQA